ncbi:MAG: Transcriptional activator protein Anr [Bacteroidia bacterium]|nr:Transcriptional activator protein Anr [Bacteroidia bacterium]
MTSCNKCKVFKQCFASLLNADELSQLEAGKSTHQIKKNEYLFTEGTSCKKIYTITSGTILLKYPTPSGQPLILGLARPGNVLGTASLMPESKNVLTTKAFGDTTLCGINKTLVEKLMDNNKAVRNHLMNIIFQRQQLILRYTIIMLAGKTITKLAYALLVFCEKDGSIIASKETIANMAGLRRETVSRLLRKLKDNKILTSSQREIKIINKEKLQQLAFKN